MKSNRHPPLLRALRRLGTCGIDTCSPAEVARARACGFAAENISFTGTALSDADLADYVAGVMTRSISADPEDPLQDIARGFTHAADFLSIISSAKGRMRFHLQVAAGNQFLVLTGLYPGFLKARCEKRGGPDLEFYESFAQKAFRGAADNRQAPGNASRQLFGTLAEAMPVARLSLNRVAEEFVFLGD